MACILIHMVQIRMRLSEIIAFEIFKGVNFKKVGWQLAKRNFKAKTFPKWALLTAKFGGALALALA